MRHKVILKYCPVTNDENKRKYDNLDAMVEVGLALRDARNGLEEECKYNLVTCEVRAGGMGQANDVGTYPVYYVQFENDQEGADDLLQKIVGKFVDSAGMPHFLQASGKIKEGMKGILSKKGFVVSDNVLAKILGSYKVVRRKSYVNSHCQPM